MKKDFLKQVTKYLKTQEAVIIETSLEGPLTPLFEKHLENIPKRPQILIGWKGQKMLGFISDKDELFHAKDGKNKTGGDWPTFQFLYHIEAVTGLDIVLIIHDNFTNNWHFRQLSQLPKPVYGWRDRCLAFEYKRKDEILNCVKCWKKNPQTCAKCMKKKQPTAVWDSKEFASKFIIQTRLL